MSLFGNWPLPCFCCCSCCWNSLSLKSLQLWLHLFGQRILWKSITTETDEYSSAHTGKKWIGWQQLELLFMGGLSPWLGLVSWCPQIWWSISSPGPYCCLQDTLYTDYSLKVIFLPTIFQISDSFHKERMALFSYLEKETSFIKLRIKILRF